MVYLCSGSRSAKVASCTTTVLGIATVSAVQTVVAFSVANVSHRSKIVLSASSATVNSTPQSAPPVRNQSQVNSAFFGSPFVYLMREKWADSYFLLCYGALPSQLPCLHMPSLSSFTPFHLNFFALYCRPIFFYLFSFKLSFYV